MGAIITLDEAVCHSNNLSRAFARYRQYRGLWVPGIPMSAVQAAPVGPMLKLAEELRTGRYRPYPPHTISIAKANGERRELKVFTIRDRVAQRALLQVLQSCTEQMMSPFSYGYRPGRGVAQALGKVREFLAGGLTWVLDADIERCFDHIPLQALLDQVAYRLGDPAAADWVARCMDWQDARSCAEVGIPQGAVLSPWLCNVYMWQLDDRMRQSTIAMVRFADDFVLLSATRLLAERAWQCCADAVRSMRLRLHPLKTALIEASQPFRFLGQQVRLPRLLPPLLPEGG